MHTTFEQTGAATGRLSSSDPNLQNIPMRTPQGRAIRRAFVAAPGSVLVGADYSQIELRVMAHLSGDPNLIEAFRSGEDVHASTARRIFGVTSGELDPALRARAKIVNFGVMYGMGARSLAQQMGISLADAQEFISGYFRVYAGVRAYLDRTLEEARSRGWVATLLGRRRYLPQLALADGLQRSNAERAAINTPIQGSAADLVKLAMLRVDAELSRGGRGARLLLQVHDELLVECPESRGARRFRILLKREMEGCYPMSVPLTVSVGRGRELVRCPLTVSPIRAERVRGARRPTTDCGSSAWSAARAAARARWRKRCGRGGARLIEADASGTRSRTAIREVRAALIAEYGERVYRADGQLDRARVGRARVRRSGRAGAAQPPGASAHSRHHAEPASRTAGERLSRSRGGRCRAHAGLGFRTRVRRRDRRDRARAAPDRAAGRFARLDAGAGARPAGGPAPEPGVRGGRGCCAGKSGRSGGSCTTCPGSAAALAVVFGGRLGAAAMTFPYALLLSPLMVIAGLALRTRSAKRTQLESAAIEAQDAVEGANLLLLQGARDECRAQLVRVRALLIGTSGEITRQRRDSVPAARRRDPGRHRQA